MLLVLIVQHMSEAIFQFNLTEVGQHSERMYREFLVLKVIPLNSTPLSLPVFKKLGVKTAKIKRGQLLKLSLENPKSEC